MKCNICDTGVLVREAKLQEFNYKGKSIVLEQSGLWCNFCGEGILSGEDIAKTEKAFDEFKLRTDS